MLMNKPVYLVISTLDLSKTVRYEFWYNYVKPEYDKNAKFFYMNTDSLIVHIKTGVMYQDIIKNIGIIIWKN